MKLRTWHRTEFGLLAFAVGEFALSYGFVSWAIDSGRLSVWTAAIVLFIGAINNTVKFTWKLVHGHKATSTR